MTKLPAILHVEFAVYPRTEWTRATRATRATSASASARGKHEGVISRFQSPQKKNGRTQTRRRTRRMTSVYNERRLTWRRASVLVGQPEVTTPPRVLPKWPTRNCPSMAALGPMVVHVYRNDTIDTFIQLDNSLSACTRS